MEPRRAGPRAVFAAVGLALAGCAAPDIEPSAPQAQGCAAGLEDACRAVRAYARRLIEEGETPGLVVALTSRDGWVWSEAFGQADLKTGRAVTPDTLFEIGSISKTFTALALLQLMEEGRFDPRAPVTDYLPWFEVRTDWAPITGHHLLTHTSGLPLNRDDVPTSKYMAYAVREQSVGWPPGERFYYSNIGYQVLSAVLEAIAGRPVGEVVEDRILAPLGMASSRARITTDLRPRLAQSYQAFFDDRPVHPSRPLVEAPWLEYDSGDGNVVATAADLAAFLRMLLRRGAAPAGRIVSAETFELFLDPPGALEMLPGNRYGYGILVSRAGGHTQLYHYGGMVGFVSALRGDLDTGLGAVAFVNGGPGRAIPLTTYAVEALNAARAGEPVPEPPPPAGDRRRIDDAGDYAGTYRAPSGDRQLELTAEGDRLFVTSPSWPPGVKVPLESYGDDAFFASHATIEGLDRFLFRFARNEAGEVAEVFHGEDWYVGEKYGGPLEFEVPEPWRAYAGHYRCHSPWFSNFRVLLRKDELLLVTPRSAETSFRVHRLVELEPGVFQIGDEESPERLRFDAVVDGEALRAVWTGQAFYRFFTP